MLCARGPEWINWVSIISYGKVQLDLRRLRLASLILEQIIFVSQGHTVYCSVPMYHQFCYSIIFPLKVGSFFKLEASHWLPLHVSQKCSLEASYKYFSFTE